MTEEEWLACREPDRLLKSSRGQVGERKRRLFACAIVASLSSQYQTGLPPAAMKALVDSAETGDWGACRSWLTEITSPMVGTYYGNSRPGVPPYVEVGSLVHPRTVICILEGMKIFNQMVAEYCGIVIEVSAITGQAVDYSQPLMRLFRLPASVEEDYRHHGLPLIRDIFGNPFRPVAFDPRWQSETAVSLATAIYAERAFDRMPILADALEDAGCDNADILTHCRGDGPHVRGCWVIDLILGKS